MFRFIGEILAGAWSLVKGLFVTLKHMWRPSITITYPEKKAHLPIRFRGRLVMPVDPAKNEVRCTACMLCQKICPNHSIDITKLVDAAGKPQAKPSSFRFNLATCMFCNLCVEVCPFFALVMSDEYELDVKDKSALSLELVAERYAITGVKAAWWEAKLDQAHLEVER